MAPSASFFMCSLRGEWPWDHSGTDMGTCLVVQGVGYTVFPKHGSQSPPRQTSAKEAVGALEFHLALLG